MMFMKLFLLDHYDKHNALPVINDKFIKPYHKINGEYKNEIKKSKYALDYSKIS